MRCVCACARVCVPTMTVRSDDAAAAAARAKARAAAAVRQVHVPLEELEKDWAQTFSKFKPKKPKPWQSHGEVREEVDGYLDRHGWVAEIERFKSEVLADPTEEIMEALSKQRAKQQSLLETQQRRARQETSSRWSKHAPSTPISRAAPELSPRLLRPPSARVRVENLALPACASLIV